MLDSIVDSFFPFLEEIEKEVMVIENMAFSEDPVNAAPPPPPPMRDPDEKPAQNSPGSFTVGDSLKTSLPKDLSPPPERPPEEKPHVIFTGPSTGAKDQRATVRLPLLPMRLALRRLRRRMRKFARRAILKVFPWFDPQRPTKSCISAGEGTGAGAALRRMARTRRLVTNLTRLLATKADVVSRMQKRLLSQAHGDPAGLAGGGLSGTNAGVTGAPNRHGLADILEGRESASLGDGARSRGAAKIAIYYGDVQGITSLPRNEQL